MSKHTKLTFSGHESFQCRSLWLKKGYDYVKMGKTFSDPDAVIVLGVGKNMVTSIRFWMKAFNLLDGKDQLTNFANLIFDDNGFDPYMEDEATLWLLHYNLVKTGLASTYFLIFNELRKEKVEFTKEGYINYVGRKNESGTPISLKTLAEDFAVFTKMYVPPDVKTKDKEESFSGLLNELSLVNCYRRAKDEYFSILNHERDDIPEDVLLYAILDGNENDLSFDLQSLENGTNSVGNVFALSKSSILAKIQNIASEYPEVVFSDNSGVRELQFKERPSLETILGHHYAN